MSLSLNYPTVSPSLLLDFAASGVLDPRITFTRATTAVYYDGTTSALAEQNLILYSQQFENAVWSAVTLGTTVTADTAVAPNGTTTADTLSFANSAYRYNSYTAGTLTGRTFTFSCWVWTATAKPVIGVRISNSSGTEGTALQVSLTGTATRVSVTRTFTSTDTVIICGFDNRSGQGGNNLAGDIIAWGAQLEERSTMTAYTPTTTATVTNYIPQLLTAPAGSARFEHDPTTEEAYGLLIEEARTNAFTYSADFSNAAWPKTNVIVQNTAGIAPDGSQTLNKIIADTTNGNHFYYRSLGTLANGTYTYSIYAKQGGLTRFLFYLNQAGSNVNTEVTFVGGVAVAGTAAVSGSVYSAASAGSTSVGNGVYRITLSFTVTGSAGDNAAFILYSPDQTTTGFAGNGYDGIYIWGAQFETGAFATSYIATTTTALPRSADVVALTGTNFSSWYNQGAGTIYVEGRFLSEPAYASGSWSQRFFDISDGTVTNGIRCFREESSALDWIRATVVSNTTLVVLSNTTNTTNNIDYKICVGYETNNCALSLAGQAVVASVAVALPLSVNRMNIGSTSFASQGFLNGTVKQLTYYPDRVTNAQLVTLTRG